MRKQRLLMILAVIMVAVSLLTITVSAETFKWQEEYDGWYLYRDGELVTSEVVWADGAWYGFDYYGLMQDNTEFYCNGYYYRAKAGGKLYANEWFQEDDSWFYYGEGGQAAEGWQQIDGKWYYFSWDGRMYQNRIFYDYDEGVHYVINEDGSQYKKLNKDGWNDAFGKWYYIKDNSFVSGEALLIDGAMYAFDYSGAMLADCVDHVYIQDVGYGYVRAKADGKLYRNAWFQDGEKNYYYYGSNGFAANGWLQLGSDWYYFEYNGRMVQDNCINDGDAWYVLNKDGNRYVKLSGNGWRQAFGEWYYLIDSVPVYYDILEIDGKVYCIEDYKMVTNQFVWYNYTNCFAGPDGYLLRNSWAQYEGKYIYLGADYKRYEYGVYKIGNEYYYFENSYLRTLGGEYNGYYVTNGSGTLYRNKWYLDTTGYEHEIGWRYYGEDARYVYGAAKIGGAQYYFDGSGIMMTDCIEQGTDGVYKYGSDGVGKKLANNSWHQDAEGEWYYVKDNALCEGWTKIGGSEYYFYSDGQMAANTWAYYWNSSTESEEYYLLGADGAMITKPGWALVNNKYYYVKNSYGTLQTGWLYQGGQWYYLSPAMAANTTVYAYDEGVLYYANSKGACKPVTATGLNCITYSYGDGYYEYITVYVNANGKLATNTWKKIGNDWFYFGESGEAFTYGSYLVDGVRYLFGEDGKMVTSGWYYCYGSWYYSTTGTAVTGLQTIGGKQYIFNEYGALITSEYNATATYNGAKYLVAADGHVIKKLANGWNQVGNDWYYLEDGNLVTDDTVKIDGAIYGFDEDGKMLSGGVYYVWGDYYSFGADGKAITGWHKVNGKWTYGTEYGHIPWSTYGIPNANGEYKEYMFQDGYLQIGTFIRWQTLYTTDSDGVIISETPLADGLHYVDGDGIYLKNGNPYTGWVGNYFFDDGYMVYNRRISYNGNYYYMDETGKMVTGWYKMPEYSYYAYIYAFSDGTLACSEWLKQGNTWYYFDGIYMVWDGIYAIGDERHEFDENGKWLGKVTESETQEFPNRADGWQKIKGEWYYYLNGAPIRGRAYIDQVWYAFDSYDCTMIANGFYNGYYHDANGAMVKYIGWQKINGSWAYFGADYQVQTGYVAYQDGFYDFYLVYDEDDDKYYVECMTDWWANIEGRLYKFDSTGFGKLVTTNGWNNLYGSWFYLKDGCVVTGYQNIGGVGYYFDYEGEMNAARVNYVQCFDHYRLFGNDGAMITKAGWHKTANGWAYVDANGNAYSNGIYKIDGTVYSFQEGFWVE